MINIITRLRHACDSHQIYIYGAGKYGRSLYAFMQEQDIRDIEKFIVSESNGESAALGKEVITLKEYDSGRILECRSAEADLIIVAVSGKYNAEIVRQLESRKLYNYLILPQEEWDVICNAVLFDTVTPQKNIAVLMYHRVIDSNFNFWKLNISPATFEKQIKYISENYNVLRLEEEWDGLVEAEQRYVVITFDDGYVDNYQYALPILEKYHVPATIFVSTDLIDTNEMYWWDELEKIFIIDKYIGEFEFNEVLYRVTDSADREKVCLTIRNCIKNMNPMERKNSMSVLRSVLGVGQSYTSELRCMNTMELTQMAASPFITIGGHTKSHLSMGAFHPRELLRSEVEESLNILENKINKKVKVFAYPFGGAEDWCSEAERIIVECGIKKSLLVRNGNISVKDDMHNLPRYMVFEGENIEMKMRKIWGLYG